MDDNPLLIHDLVTNPGNWEYRPDTSEYRRYIDNARVTEEAYRRYQGISVSGRQAGKPSAQLSAGPIFQPTRKAVLPNVPTDHTIVRWKAFNRLTYVAVYVKATGLWYITGTGAQYGGNEFTDDQFRTILADEHTSRVQLSESWHDLEV